MFISIAIALLLQVPSTDDVLARSVKLYSSLKSYSDTGRVTDTFGPQPTSVYTHTFKTYFRAPRNFYFEFNADKRSGGARYVIWCDGGDFQSWSSTSGKHETYPRGSDTAALAFRQIAWATKGAVTLVPSLLFAGSGLIGTLNEVAETSDAGLEAVDGHRAQKLVGVARSVYPKTNRVTNVRRAVVWLDPDTHLVRQVFEDTPKGLPASAVARITITIDPQMNAAIEDGRFRFAVPAEQR